MYATMLGRFKTVLLIIIFFSGALILLTSISEMQKRYSLNIHFQKIDLKTNLQQIIKCENKKNDFKVYQRSDYFVLMNYVKADKMFACYETITFTTHADYTFLNNVPILVERWKGPISIAIYAPGDDFQPTLNSIAYLRNCATRLVKEYVTFHIFFKSNHFPIQEQKLVQDFNDQFDCEIGVPYENVDPESLYKRRNKLTYPINIARNIARQSATTHFVFACDIELYPTLNFIEKFLKMIAENPAYENLNDRHIYAVPIFEIKENETIPDTKTRLQKMIKTHKAYLFHRRLCVHCHLPPKYKEWLALPETDNVQALTVSKRVGFYAYWEAVFVGTNADPLFDERLCWEGQRHASTQAYAMCLLDYNYIVMDNLYLVHKPGIEEPIPPGYFKYRRLVYKTRNFVKKTIKPELNLLYGKSNGCSL